MKRKIVFLFFFIIITFCKTNQAKYIIEQKTLIAKINIDMFYPRIELMNITSMPYKEENIYKFNIQVKVIENNIKDNKFNKEKIKITISEKEINKELYNIDKIKQGGNYIIYEIKIEKIQIDGNLIVIIPEGIIIDYANNQNTELQFTVI